MSAQSATAIPTDVREAAQSTLDRTVTTRQLTKVFDRPTRRWYGIGAFAMVTLGVGAIMASPGLMLAAALGIGFAMYYRLQPVPAAPVEVRRTVDETEPSAGDEIEVTLAVENIGDETLFDLRIIDGVPTAFEVVDGSARHATALRPGQTAEITYTVETGRGYQAFEPVMLIARDVAGTSEVAYEADVQSRVHAELPEEHLSPLALRGLTAGMTGRISTDDGGSGVEFHAVREYRPGDPLNRIDWNRRARSGELATVDFRREQMATVVLVIDLRPASYVGRPDAERPATEPAIEAAAALFDALLDAGDRVGITTLGEDGCWLPPGVGADHREHGRMLFNTHPSLGSKRPGGAVSVISEEWELDHRIPDSTQLVFLSPMADGGAARYVTRFESRGHPVTVISPDPSGTETVGQTVATIERQLRLRRLRDRGIRIIDWNDDERELAAAIEMANTRWS